MIYIYKELAEKLVFSFVGLLAAGDPRWHSLHNRWQPSNLENLSGTLKYEMVSVIVIPMYAPKEGEH